MRFIHCADLHIGKGQNGSAERYEDFFRAFFSVARTAVEEEVDFIIVAGDMFDTKSVSSATLWQVTRALAELREKGIKVYAIEGNHDKAFYFERESWLCFLNNLDLLILLKPDYNESALVLNPYDGHTGAICEEEGYRVIGLGYFGALTKKRIEEASMLLPKKDRYTVILLHAALQHQMSMDMAGVEKECMLTLREYADYLALGHIHRRYEGDAFIYNPGSLEYVDSAEARRSDRKGFYLVDTKDAAKSRFCAVEPRQHLFASVDISGVQSEDEARQRVFCEIEKTAELHNPVIEVDLSGETPLETYKLNIPELQEEIKEKYGAVSVNVTTYLMNTAGEAETETHIDREQLEKTVMRQIMKETGYGESIAERMAEFALSVKNSVNNNFSAEEIANTAEELAALQEDTAYAN